MLDERWNKPIKVLNIDLRLKTNILDFKNTLI